MKEGSPVARLLFTPPYPENWHFPLICCNILFCRYIFISRIYRLENIGSICVLYERYLLILSKYIFLWIIKIINTLCPLEKTNQHTTKKHFFALCVIVYLYTHIQYLRKYIVFIYFYSVYIVLFHQYSHTIIIVLQLEYISTCKALFI